MATGTTNVGFEEQLWQAADKLRSNMDAAEYKHVVLGLIFLKYVSDSFTEKYNALIIIPEQKDPARNCKANRLYMDIIVL